MSVRNNVFFQCININMVQRKACLVVVLRFLRMVTGRTRKFASLMVSIRKEVAERCIRTLNKQKLVFREDAKIEF